MGTFDEVVRELLSDPRVSRAAMFGHPAVKIAGRVFAMEFEGEMVVKVGNVVKPLRLSRWVRVPAAGADSLIGRRRSKERVARWTVLAREAELFVSEGGHKG